MSLKLKEFSGISFLPEESVSLLIVHVGTYLVALVCILPFIDYLFRVCLIFWFLYFDLCQVEVQLVCDLCQVKLQLVSDLCQVKVQQLVSKLCTSDILLLMNKHTSMVHQ
jgi:hypothetical protein